jgi:hypothetical protein
MQKAGLTTRARQSGISEGALLSLARRITHDVEDVATAFRELERAVEVAIRVQAEGTKLSNHGDFVDRVLAEVARLSRDGAYTAALGSIETALEQEEAESRARRTRLICAAVEQEILARNAPGVAARLVQQAEAEGRGGFDDLRALQDVWFVRGRDAGLNFDLAVSVALARLTLSRATDADGRGAALNDLAIALSTLGARESGTARLEEAVAAHRAALEERTRDRVPLNWAITQMNLAFAEVAFFDKTADPAHLDRAETHARTALDVFTEAAATHYIDQVTGTLARIASLRPPTADPRTQP